MTPDLLDELLDRSTPPTRAADAGALGAMIAEARGEVPRGRKRRGALLAGAIGLVLVGGAGVATATDGFTWGPWLQDPIGAYSLTLPSGLECEVRVEYYDKPGDLLTTAEVNRILEEWWRTTDVIAAGEALLPEAIERYREAVAIGGGAEEGSDGEYYFAWMNAIGDLEHQELAEHGYTADSGRLAGLEGGQQIQCLDENGEVSLP